MFLEKMKRWEDKRVGKPKGHFGQPNQFLLFCIKIGNVEKEWAFFPVRLEIYCKKNYFLLQYKVTVCLWKEYRWDFKCFFGMDN